MVIVGQIGIGYWGPNLLRNLHFNDDCKIKIVVDSSEERRLYVKNLYPTINVGNRFSDILNDNYEMTNPSPLFLQKRLYHS